jgi:hypothetical protein
MIMEQLYRVSGVLQATDGSSLPKATLRQDSVRQLVRATRNTLNEVSVRRLRERRPSPVVQRCSSAQCCRAIGWRR